MGLRLYTHQRRAHSAIYCSSAEKTEELWVYNSRADTDNFSSVKSHYNLLWQPPPLQLLSEKNELKNGSVLNRISAK